MTDVHTKKVRSKNMTAIKSRGNKSTEKKFENILKSAGIIGWRRHYKIKGTPDFVFRKSKLALFIDGCFWHGCKKCYVPPKSNIRFWHKKIGENINRDKKVNEHLREDGWKVVRIKEHELKKPATVLRKIARAGAQME